MKRTRRMRQQPAESDALSSECSLEHSAGQEPDETAGLYVAGRIQSKEVCGLLACGE
jgi:hypothetical protein